MCRTTNRFSRKAEFCSELFMILMVLYVVHERAVRWAVVRTIVKRMVLWDPTPCCLINKCGGLGETFQSFLDGHCVFKLIRFSLCHYAV